MMDGVRTVPGPGLDGGMAAILIICGGKRVNIGAAAELANLPAKTIRYYEDIRLITPERADNGYRSYSASDIERLRFLQRARGLGFSIEECRQLVSLYQDTNRASAEVRSIASAKIIEIDAKIEQLVGMRKTLSALVSECRGNSEPKCAIIDELSGKDAT